MAKVEPKATGVGAAHTFRIIWGILTLLSCGWIAYGLLASGAAVGKVVTEATPTVSVINNAQGTPIATLDSKTAQGAKALGATIGGGLGVIFFICTGGPLLLIFGLLYWRNGVAIKRAREHAETLAAMQNRPVG